MYIKIIVTLNTLDSTSETSHDLTTQKNENFELINTKSINCTVTDALGDWQSNKDNVDEKIHPTIN